MKLKEGVGWKAAWQEEKNLAGAEVIFQGSWALYEISPAVFSQLRKGMRSSEAEALIRTGRRLYLHVNDRCGPPYTVVLDENYAKYCPWMAKSEPAGKTWPKELTEAARQALDPD